MENSEVKIATNIDTDIFYSIIEFLKKNKWDLAAEYDENIFDKGIDFDFYQFCKGEEKITLAWGNWFEGEMEGNAKALGEIAQHFKISLKYNEPEYLQKSNLIDEMKLLIKFYK